MTRSLSVFCLVALMTVMFALPVCSQPIANFTPDRWNICSGTPLILTNSSTAANAYEWLIENVHYSFSRDTTVILYEGCYDLKTITLRAWDTLTGAIDTHFVAVEVFDSCFFHWTGDFFNCPGDTINMLVNPEEISTEFTINAPYTLLNGCLTCPSLSIILTTPGTLIDRKSTYTGGCSEITSYHYLCFINDEEELSEVKLRIYPNPVSGSLFIESAEEIKNISIYDLPGKLVYTRQGQGISNSSLDVSGFVNGIYFIKAETISGRVLQRKIIKN